MLEMIGDIPIGYLQILGVIVVILLVVGILKGLWFFVKIAAIVTVVYFILSSLNGSGSHIWLNNIKQSEVTQQCVTVEL